LGRPSALFLVSPSPHLASVLASPSASPDPPHLHPSPHPQFCCVQFGFPQPPPLAASPLFALAPLPPPPPPLLLVALLLRRETSSAWRSRMTIVHGSHGMPSGFAPPHGQISPHVQTVQMHLGFLQREISILARRAWRNRRPCHPCHTKPQPHT
jgi:hypothetical protein